MFNIESQKTIKVGNTGVIANYPNVGQKRMIEARKLLFSDGIYGDIARSAHITGDNLLETIDAYSYLSICCPDLKLTPELFDKLDPITERVLVLAYVNEFRPWYKGIEEKLMSFDPNNPEGKPAEEETDGTVEDATTAE